MNLDLLPVIIYAVLIPMILLLVVKGLIALITKNAIVKSKTLNKDEKANLFYLLPKALLSITTTAKVRIEEDEGANNVKVSVLSQEFEVSPKIIGDNNYPIALEYKTHPFYNDVVSFSVGENGLLQTVNTKVKDETSTIVTSITDATKAILTTKSEVEGVMVSTTTKVSIKELTYTTIVDPKDDVQIISWNPLVGNEGSTNLKDIDLGFKLTKDSNYTLNLSDGGSSNGGSEDNQLSPYGGIYTRPIVTNKFEIASQSASLKNNPASFFIEMPSLGNVLKVPLKRGHFIEKTNDLVLTNGLITSNSITKPSELVGFVSIPIDVIKAIVSIPAQLLTFTLNRTTQLKDLEKQKGLLATERIKNENAQLTRDLKLQQDIKATQAAIANSEKSIVDAKKAILDAIGDGKKIAN